MPFCEAKIVQVPGDTSVTVPPADTLQNEVVAVVYVTGNPDEDVAAGTGAGPVIETVPSAGNVIALGFVPERMLKVWVTGDAAA